MQQMQEISKQKPRATVEDGLVAEVQRLQSALTLVNDDLSAARHTLDGKQKELRHIKGEMKKLTPDVEQVRHNLHYFHSLG